MEGGNQVGAIIYRKLRFIVQGNINMFIVCYLILALDGISRNSIFYQCSGGIILGAEWVRGAENNVGSAIL
ncbi:hypothetical protein ES703_52350 [subsurface metagenome]